MIDIKHLSKSFGDLNVLKNVSLQLEEGKVLVLIGPSGTGKSTLLRCINYLEKPDDGIRFILCAVGFAAAGGYVGVVLYEPDLYDRRRRR